MLLTFPIFHIQITFLQNIPKRKNIILQGAQISLVAFDACPKVGFNLFFNFVGYLEQQDLEKLYKNIQKVEDSQIIIGIGHFPLSVLQIPKLFPLKQITSSISTYLCGHLHRMAGEELRTVHSNGMGELEIPDLKNAGIFRVVSVDHCLLNFHDFRANWDFFLMITNPKNAKFYVGRENGKFVQNSSNIRILLFSKKPIKNSESKFQLTVRNWVLHHFRQMIPNYGFCLGTPKIFQVGFMT